MADSPLNTPQRAPAQVSGQRSEPSEELGRLWDQGTREEVDAFLKGIGPLRAAEWAEVVHVDQHHRWRSGERTTAEDYLRRFPNLCDEEDAAVDVIFHEYLLRERLGEQPSAKEYADRFPSYAEAIGRQIAFHGLMAKSDSRLAKPRSRESAVASTSPAALPTGRTEPLQIGLVPRGGLSSSREIQSLLRSRLRLLAAITCVAFLLYIPVLWPLFTFSWGTALYAAVVVYAGVIAMVLSSRRMFSLSALRWIEAGLFLGLLAFFGYQQVQFFQSGFFSALTVDRWIGPAIAARSMSWTWAVTIITYGILIPNTARRCFAAVAAMVGGFLTITLILAFSASAAPRSALAVYVLCSLADMSLAAAVAVFGAYRIAALQQAASEMRKLGPYRLIRHLGSGGMGEVYLAEHALLRRPCALKLIRPGQDGDARFLSRFEREVQAMATLTHPNTVRVYDYGLASDGTFYYAMEFLPGLSLQELVTRHGPLPAERAVYLLRQVCGALREAHAVGLVHRDIKPANILACHSGGMHDVAKLLDFGLVRVQSLGEGGESLSGIGTIAGTPAFMSPEQAAGVVEIDERSDIYGLGAVAYFLLTGRPPFVEPTSVEIMAAHLTGQVVAPSKYQSCVPVDVEAIVLRCLEKDRSDRFGGAAALEDALSGTECAHLWSSQAAADWWQRTADLTGQAVSTVD